MEKKISLKEWTDIGKYNPAAKWIRPFCAYSLTKEGNKFTRICKISVPLYIILFIPVHVVEFFYCVWDGGIKEFTFEGRHLGYDEFVPYHGEVYNKVKEIWEKK